MKRDKHYLGRPTEPLTKCLRLTTNGRWVKDDGKTPGRAFSGENAGNSGAHGFPYWYGPDCDCLYDKDCPSQKARDKTCERFGAANGQRMMRKR